MSTLKKDVLHVISDNQIHKSIIESDIHKTKR